MYIANNYQLIISNTRIVQIVIINVIPVSYILCYDVLSIFKYNVYIFINKGTFKNVSKLHEQIKYIHHRNIFLKWLRLNSLILQHEVFARIYFFIYQNYHITICHFSTKALERKSISTYSYQHHTSMGTITFFCIGPTIFYIKAYTWFAICLHRKRHISIAFVT